MSADVVLPWSLRDVVGAARPKTARGLRRARTRREQAVARLVEEDEPEIAEPAEELEAAEAEDSESSEAANDDARERTSGEPGHDDGEIALTLPPDMCWAYRDEGATSVD